MDSIQYKVQYVPDAEFWKKLSQLPAYKGHFPTILRMSEGTSFGYAPYNVLEGYDDWDTVRRGCYFAVPPTSTPITNVGYLFAPPHEGMWRRLYVVFAYSPGQALLAECSPLVLLRKPLGLRLPSGAVYEQGEFSVSAIVVKGDDAPINFSIAGPHNPAVRLLITESAASVPVSKPSSSGQGNVPTVDAPALSVLKIRVCIPGMASFEVNPSGMDSV